MWSQIISSTLFSRCSIWIKYQPNPGYGNPPEELDFAYWTSVQCSTAVLPIAKQSQCSKFSISAGLLPSMSHEGGLRWVRSVHMSSQPGFRHHDLTWEGSTWRTLLGQLVHFPRLQCLWSMEDEEARLDSAVLLRTWSVNVPSMPYTGIPRCCLQINLWSVCNFTFRCVALSSTLHKHYPAYKNTHPPKILTFRFHTIVPSCNRDGDTNGLGHLPARQGVRFVLHIVHPKRIHHRHHDC